MKPPTIEGVVFQELVTHTDDRGFFREIIRANDPFFSEGFGQWSQSLMYQETIKAWHIHKIQIDWWFVPIGVLKVVLHDLRPESPTYRKTMEFLMGESQPAFVLRIPQQVAHGCKVLQGPAHLFYVTSKIYNPADEGRLPYNDPAIGYDWLARPKIT